VSVLTAAGAVSTVTAPDSKPPVPLAPRIAAACLALALAAGLTGCRQRAADRAPATGAVTSQNGPAGGAPAVTAALGDAPTATQSAAPSNGQAVNQQDIDNLQGILASVNGAVTSARSAIAGDANSPQG
jgi:hypothetical protein